jgi:SPP1 family predicted phage head-tail adaptor
MKKVTLIGKLNSKITFQNFKNVQDEFGGNSLQQVGRDFTIWAEVQNRTGGYEKLQDAQTFVYDYKIIFRYNEEITSTTKFIYKKERLKIESLTIVSEHKKDFMIAKCSKISI